MPARPAWSIGNICSPWEPLAANPTTVSQARVPPPPLRLSSTLRCCVALWIVLVPSLVGYSGLFACEGGVKLLVRTEARFRSALVSTPLSQRGVLYDVGDFVLKVSFQLPLFIAGFGGDRLTMYRSTHESLGDITPFSGGVAMHSYRDVAAVIANATQPRGQYLGAMPVPDRCMGRSTLIFQGTGPSHKRGRDLLIQTLDGLSKKKDAQGFRTPLVSEPGTVGDPALANDEVIKRSIVRNLWSRLFKTTPDAEFESVLFSYYVWGGTCVLGDKFHALTFNYFLNRVEDIRKRVFAAANVTDVGRRVRREAKKQRYAAQETDDMLMQVVDGFLFAGLLGTGHLVTHTLNFIRANPDERLPLWHENPEAFLLESARVDPPVTSVTALLPDDITLDVGSGSRGTGCIQAFFERNTTAQLVISEANVDPFVFGGPDASVTRAREFDPRRDRSELNKILSWNGVHSGVIDGSAPRGCLGYHVSFDVALKVVNRFLPTKEAMLVEVHPATAAAESRVFLRAGDPDNAFGLASSALNNEVAYMLWLFVCAFAFYYIRTPYYGRMSECYAHFLIAQIFISIAFLIGVNGFAEHMYVQAGYAYYRCALVWRTHRLLQKQREGRNARDHDTACVWPSDGVPGRIEVGIAVGCMHVMLALAHFLIGSGADAPFCKTMAIALFVPAQLTLFAALYGMWNAQKLNSKMKYRLLKVVAGCAISLFNMVWPYYVFHGSFYNFLRSIFDTVAVGFTCSALVAIDGELAQTYDAKAKSEEEYELFASKGRRNLRLFGIGSVLVFVGIFLHPLIFDAVRGGKLCFYEDEYEANATLCEKGDEYLSMIDYHSRSLYRVLRKFASSKGQSRPDGSAVRIPTEMYGNRAMKKLFFGMDIPTWDEDVPSNWLRSLASTSIFDYLRNGHINRLQDVAVEFNSSDEARDVFRIAAQEDLRPLELTSWEEMRSDEAISRFAFAGLAAHRMQRTAPTSWYNVLSEDYNVAYKNDWEYLKVFEVRPGFEKYGAIAYFDSRAHLRKIYWSMAERNVTPGDRDWEHAKWVFKCSVIAGATLTDHLVGIHFMTSNFMTSSSQKNLRPDHPLRRLLKPHTYGAVTVNMGATTTLASEFSVLHRASSFTWPAVMEGFKVSVALNRFVPMSEVLKESGMDTASSEIYPYGQDMRDFVRVVHKFVKGYIGVYYKDDAAVTGDKEVSKFWHGLRQVKTMNIPTAPTKKNLINGVVLLIVKVTAMHNQVGNVADYLVDPRFASPKIRPGREVADVQAAFQGLAIGLMTANLQPRLINNFTHLVLQDEHVTVTSALFEAFQVDLKALVQKIDKRNKNRRFPCNAFNPRTMVSSVSI